MMLPSPAAADQPLSRSRLRVLEGGNVGREPVTLDRFIGWYSGHFDLVAGLERVTDPRNARAKIPLPTMLLAVVVGFWVGIKSLLELEDRLKHNPGLCALLGRQTGYGESFSDDAVRDTFTKLDWTELRRLVLEQGQRGIKRWGAQYFADSVLARRLRPIHASHLAAKLVVAVDGHEVFSSTERCCADCRVRVKTVERNGKKVPITEYYHTVVVAHWVGTHPGLVLDFERVLPGKGELSTAYRLLARLGKVYGDDIGIVLADALYDCEPWRRLVRKLGYRTIHAQKDARRDPGRSGRRALDARDAKRRSPDWTYTETATGYRYAVWEQPVEGGGRRYIEAVRTAKDGMVHKVTLVTDLPAERASAVAVVKLYEVRWFIEDQAFHELSGRWGFDHAYVHKGRPAAAWTYLALSILAFNAMQMYVYRHLHRQAGARPRPLDAYRHDLRETMILCSRPSGRTTSSITARGP